ncbi:head GIN domain-containing protein [Lacinutrix salivirga]
MKTLITTLVLFLTITLTAQHPLEKNVGNFNEVKVFDLIKISLVKSDVNKVIITGDDVDDVEVVNKNGKLKIRMNLDRAFDGNKTFVAVHYTTLDVIDGNEGAKIIGNELIEQDHIELRAQEGAQLLIGLNVNTVEIRAVSGGIIETKGKANKQDITLNTGGIYEGKEFLTKTTAVKVRAAGEAEVNASKSVDAKITAGGDIYIYGDPEKINKKTTFGGRIETRPKQY